MHIVEVSEHCLRIILKNLKSCLKALLMFTYSAPLHEKSAIFLAYRVAAFKGGKMTLCQLEVIAVTSQV